MNAGGVAHPDVGYTNIAAQLDELVIAYTSGLMAPGPNAVCGQRKWTAPSAT